MRTFEGGICNSLFTSDVTYWWSKTLNSSFWDLSPSFSVINLNAKLLKMSEIKLQLTFGALEVYCNISLVLHKAHPKGVTSFLVSHWPFHSNISSWKNVYLWFSLKARYLPKSTALEALDTWFSFFSTLSCLKIFQDAFIN